MQNRVIDGILQQITRMRKRLEILEAAGNGTEWIPLPYTTSGSIWADYSGSYLGGYYKRSGGVVYLAGVVARTFGSSNVIATMPVGFRPSNTILFSTMSNSSIARVYLYSNGELTWIAGGSPTAWVTLNALYYPIGT